MRPKNRRPPGQRSASNSQSNSANTSSTSTNGLPRIDSISEITIDDTLDSLETSANITNNNSSSLEVISNQLENSSSSPINNTPPPPSSQQQQNQETNKPIPILRKSSSRMSRNSDVFEELEIKLPTLRKPAVSPDSLDSDSRSSNDALNVESDNAVVEETMVAKSVPPKPTPRTASTGSDKSLSSPLVSTPRRRLSSTTLAQQQQQRLSKSPDSLESNSPGWLSKSNEGIFEDLEMPQKPIAAARKLLPPMISKSQERVCCSKSSDSLENVVNNSEDSMERRRSSFEIRPRRSSQQLPPTTTVLKQMSKSTECFDSCLVDKKHQLQQQQHQQQLLQQSRLSRIEDKRKRASVSEINLSSRIGSSAKPLLLSNSFEKIANLVEAHKITDKNYDNEKTINSSSTTTNLWKPSVKRVQHSSESSDNLELDDNCRLENRVRRSTPKRLSSGSSNGNNEEFLLRKTSPRLLQKSSESLELLGSTDTLDSERRNTIKSSDSEETLDSLEKELFREDRENHEEIMTDNLVIERCEEENNLEVNDDDEDRNNENDGDEKVIEPFWKRIQESSNNFDVHLYPINSKIMQENGNTEEITTNDDGNSVIVDEDDDKSTKLNNKDSPVAVLYQKKKLQNKQNSSTDDNKINSTINNQISGKTTDEDLQNILNGNISEVSSTDTKSFKEKLIMFEKLGK